MDIIIVITVTVAFVIICLIGDKIEKRRGIQNETVYYIQ
jgi:hypothetical protein